MDACSRHRPGQLEFFNFWPNGECSRLPLPTFLFVLRPVFVRRVERCERRFSITPAHPI